MTCKRIAALDLGSNSFLCLIVEGENGRIQKVISDQVQIVRLGEGVDKAKTLSAGALQRAQATLEQFAALIKNSQATEVLAVATSAARDASNSQLLRDICKNLDLPLQIYSGNEEAEISFQGAVFDQSDKDLLLVIDIGGGSTEFTLGKNKKILKRQSLNVGGVRYFERYIQTYPLPENKLNQLEMAIAGELESLIENLELDQVKSLKLLAVAGTPTGLAAAELGGFQEEKVHGYRLTIDSLRRWKSKLATSTHAEKVQFGIEDKRADIILVGVCVLLQTLEKLNLGEVIVSTKGLRYGVAMKMLST